MVSRSLLLLILFSLVIAACKENPNVNPVTTVSIGGSDYETMKIGDQTWTVRNYAGPGGVSFDQSIPSAYGKYYSQAELSTITLPAGWRIPTVADYQKLGQLHGITIPSRLDQADAIKALISKSNWKHAVGTNTSGFNAIPAGYIFGSTPPADGDIAEFWTSQGITLSIQEAGANLTSLRMVFYQSDNSPEFRFNVRFVKD